MFFFTVNTHTPSACKSITIIHVSMDLMTHRIKGICLVVGNHRSSFIGTDRNTMTVGFRKFSS